MTVPSQYIYSLMSFFIENQEKFRTNSSVQNINTRNKHHFHRPVANLSCFQKGASYSGIRIFNSLPRNITNLKNEKTHFKIALKSSKCTFLLLCGWMFHMYRWYVLLTVWLFKCILHWNIFMCFYVYDMFHILLSCDSQGSMECICVCVCMYVCSGVRTPKPASNKYVGDTVVNAELNGNTLPCTKIKWLETKRYSGKRSTSRITSWCLILFSYF